MLKMLRSKEAVKTRVDMENYVPMSIAEQMKRCTKIKNIDQNLSRIFQIDKDVNVQRIDPLKCVCWHPIRVAAICGDVDALRIELDDPNALYELDILTESLCGHGLETVDYEFNNKLNWPELSPLVESEFMRYSEFYHDYMSLKHSFEKFVTPIDIYQQLIVMLTGHTLSYNDNIIELRELSDLDFKYSLYYNTQIYELLIDNYDNLDERLQQIITDVTLYRATPLQIRAMPIHHKLPYSTQYVIDNGIDPYTHFESGGGETLHAWFLVTGFYRYLDREKRTEHMKHLQCKGNRPLDCFYPQSVHNRPDHQKEIILACYQSMRQLPKFLRWKILRHVFREPLICGLVYKEEYRSKLLYRFRLSGTTFNPKIFERHYMENTSQKGVPIKFYGDEQRIINAITKSSSLDLQRTVHRRAL